VLGQGFKDGEAELGSFLGDCQLGDVALVVGIVHEHMFADNMFLSKGQV